MTSNTVECANEWSIHDVPASVVVRAREDCQKVLNDWSLFDWSCGGDNQSGVRLKRGKPRNILSLTEVEEQCLLVFYDRLLVLAVQVS